jgi:hypothetical protein
MRRHKTKANKQFWFLHFSTIILVIIIYIYKKKQTNCIIFIVFMNHWQETCHRPNHRLPSKELDHESYNLEHIFLRLQCLCNLEEESIKKSKGKDSYRERGRGRNGQHGTGHPRKRGFSINCCLFAPYF